MGLRSTILARLREPSTAAGLAAIGLVFGFPPGLVDVGLQLVVGALGVAAIVLPEKAAQAPPPRK